MPGTYERDQGQKELRRSLGHKAGPFILEGLRQRPRKRMIAHQRADGFPIQIGNRDSRTRGKPVIAVQGAVAICTDHLRGILRIAAFGPIKIGKAEIDALGSCQLPDLR